jgi:DNA topoisomerase I
LQQEASRKLGFSVKQTMVVAQQLYEGVSLGKGEGSAGLITYMRTDSVNLSTQGVGGYQADHREALRAGVRPQPAAHVQDEGEGAQEAHEAIRPTEINRTPDSLAMCSIISSSSSTH